MRSSVPPAAVWILAQTAAATAATIVYAAFGDKIARSVNLHFTRRDVYRTGYDDGYEEGYLAGRRVARPVVIPGALRAYPISSDLSARPMRVETC